MDDGSSVVSSQLFIDTKVELNELFGRNAALAYLLISYAKACVGGDTSIDGQPDEVAECVSDMDYGDEEGSLRPAIALAIVAWAEDRNL
jgi:hypothetical protein